MASGRTSGRGCCARVAELTGLSARSPRCWWTPTGALDPCPWGAVRRSGRRGGRSGRLWTGRSVVGGSRARVRGGGLYRTLWRLCDERIDATRLPGIRAARVPARHAKFWLAVLTEIKNRSTTDVCIVVCDGLKGLPEAVTTVWDRAVIQTCVIHLLRNTFALPPASTGTRSSGISVRSVPRPPRQRPRKRFVEFTAI